MLIFRYGKVISKTKGCVERVKRTLAAVALVVIFTLALAAPAFAFEHEATYKWNGTIDFKQTAGHFCNTGAQFEQRISGSGDMTKTKDVYMEEGVIRVADTNNWVTAPDAIRNLMVTNAIKLCAPAKHVYDDIAYNPDWLGGTDAFFGLLAAASDLSTEDLNALIQANSDYADAEELAQALGFPSAAYLLEISAADAINDPQVWAVHVSANPGYSGQIDMGFEAAYSGNVYPVTSWDNETLNAYNASWFDAPYSNWPGYLEQDMGPWFAGNYFSIEQFSRTSNGVHRRYIDISSPWSHAYMKQDMTVRGMSEVYEAFTLANLAAGDEVAIVWWDIF